MKKIKIETNIYLVFLIAFTLIFFKLNDLKIVAGLTKPWIRYLMIYSIMMLLFNFLLKNTIKSFFDEKILKLLKFYWFYQIIIIIISLIDANNYFDYKFIFITYIPYLFLTLSIFLPLKIFNSFKLHDFFLKIYAPIILILLVFFFRDNLIFYTRSNSFIYFFIVFFPFIDTKKKIILTFFVLLIYFCEINWRTNLLRVSLIFSIVMLYYIKVINSQNFLFLFKFLIILPIFFLFLSIFSTFNLFDYLSIFFEKNREFFSDTRTFLFQATFNEIMINKLKLIFGYNLNSNLFIENFIFDNSYLYNVGRQNQESAFITKLYKTGLVGVFLDSLIFLVPGYYSIKYSNNDFSKLIGVLCGINYILYFVEIPIGMNIDYFSIYFIIGIASLKEIRNKTNLELLSYFKDR